MAIEWNDIDDSFNARVRDSFNTNTTNTANLSATVQNSGNTDESVNGSYNETVDVTGSFNEDSHDMDVEMDVDVDDSYNDNSDNSSDDHTDNSIEDSYSDNSDNSIDDSYNQWTDNSTDDHSTNAGVRTYNTGFGDLAVGGAAGGDVEINATSTIVDQSVNGNAMGWHASEFGSGADAVVASGAGAIAAGDDVDISQSLDESTVIAGHGDVNVGNTTTISNIVDSYNTETDNSTDTDNSWDVDIDDSFNDYSDSYTADNSFNEELTAIHESDWDVDANVIWDSEDSLIVEDVSVDTELPE